MRVAARFPVTFLMIVMLVLLKAGSAQKANAPSGRETEIRQTLAAFLTAFDNLDWPAFRAYFAPDVTMFHPAAPNVKRIDTPQEFESAWLGVFARIKKTSGRQAPPYMNLRPQEMKIQLLSQDIALVTFHLTDADTLSRRTIVLRREGEMWRIVHLHASNLQVR